MICFGNVPASAVLPIFFGSYGKTNGESITLTGLAVTDIEIYKGTSMTQRSSDAGYTLIDTDGIDVDAITGIHGFSLDLGDNTDSGFYAAGSFYTVVVSAVTIDGQTVNFIAATFRIVAAEGIVGTPKADVSALGGVAQSLTDLKDFADDGYDPATNKVQGVVLTDTLTTYTGNTLQTGDGFARLGAPAGASVSADVAAVKVDTAAILVDTGTTLDARIPAALVGGRIDSSVGAMAAAVVTAGSIAADAITDAKVASDVTIASVTGAVGSVTAAVTVGANNDKTGYGLSAAAVQAIWDALTSALTTVGSIGKLIVDNLNATISSRASQTSVDTVDDFLDTEMAATLAAVDTEVAAIKTVTDALPNAGALTSLATQASVNTIDDFLDTEVAAIKAKTDQLTFTVANTVDANLEAVDGSGTGVDKLAAHLPSVLKVVIGAGSSTTSIVLNSSTGINGGAPSATNDFYNGRVLVFTSGALAGQATSVADYVGSTVTLTVVVLTSAPSAADTAVIV